MSATPEDRAALLRAGCHGVAPLTGRLEPWQVEVCERPTELRELIAEHGSPINLIEPSPMARNAGELVDAATSAGVAFRVFFARKANKALALVDEARRLGLGVDVASERELAQTLGRGVEPADIIVTAAIKPPALLELSLSAGVTVAIDNDDELSLLLALAERSNTRAEVALRLAPELGPARLPTRFGLEPKELLAAAERLRDAGHRVAGLHFHLDGYDAQDRAAATAVALELSDVLRGSGAELGFIDIGGGIPISYLDDGEEWEQFWSELRAGLDGEREPLSFDQHPLSNVYPYHQRPVRGDWLAALLAREVMVSGRSESVAKAVAGRGIELRCEPGRSLLDGCGITVATVMFTKRRRDGELLVGLAMNRTQVRSTSDDFLVDPLLLAGDGEPRGGSVAGFLVGAYCIERELLSWRRLVFPRGVAVGDLVVFPNTAGYLMHILESASHQIPLARNLIVAEGRAKLDPIDEGI